MPAQRPRSRKWLYRTLLERDGGKCHYCECYMENDGRRSMTIDHVVPLSLGGTNSLRNLVLACYACNQHKGEMGYLEYLGSRYLRERRASLWGQVIQHHHEAIKFTRRGNWSCLCGETGRSDDDPKIVPCTLFRYGAFYQP